ncbi:MAG: protein kinase, partial [Myxococcales bacterium]|nr:protein kinase [Myxococcales bacterium]
MRGRSGAPRKIGRYEVKGALGGGGMGDVYRVFDPATRRMLALKVLKFTYPRALHYFKREFRAVAALSHPNLVQLYDLHQEDGQYFYTMEMIDGVDLYIHVNGHNRVVTNAATLCQPDRLARLRSTFVQLLRGLAFLHGQRCIHRDIKPSNVLVSREGVVKLVDFGIVKELLPGGEGQSLSQVFGTSTYFSPEQSLGSQVTAATDLYAAGVVLYELLAGTPPFEGDSADVAVMHRTEPPPSLVQRVPSAPPDLALVCMELLKKEPLDRPSAREALELLKADPEVEVAPAEFVGRRSARKALHTALGAVREGQGRTVLVEGGSGMGKSSLIEEFGREARLFGASLFTGACVMRDHVPLRGLDTLIERLAEAYRRQTARILRRIARPIRGPVIESFTFLGELLPAREHGEVDGLHELDEGLRELFAALAEKHVLVLALEQLHLADDELCDLLEALVTRDPHPPVLMVFTVRPEAVLAGSRVAKLLEVIARAPSAQRVELLPFSADETRQVLADQVDPAPAWLAEHIHGETRGVPLFVAEMVDAVRRDPQGPPPTLDEVVARRVQRLDARARDVLDVLCMSGRPPRGVVLEHACGLDVDDLYAALRDLSVAGLAHMQSTAAGEVIAVPEHGLLIDALRRTLSHERRRNLHERLARAYETHGGPLDELRRHWAESGEAEAAVRFADRTAASARAGRTPTDPEVAALALEVAQGDELRATLLRELAEGQAAAGRFGEARRTLDELIVLRPSAASAARCRQRVFRLLDGELASLQQLVDLRPDAENVPLADLVADLAPRLALPLLEGVEGPDAALVRARALASRVDADAQREALALVEAHADAQYGRDPVRRIAYARALAAVNEARGMI